MPPPMTSKRFGMPARSSAPVESTTRGSSGRPGMRAGSEPAATMHCSKPMVFRAPLSSTSSTRCAETKRAVPRTTVTLRCLARIESPAVELADDAVLPLLERARIDLRRLELDAVHRHRLGFLDHAGGMQQRLGRNAADIEADAAELRPAVDERDGKAEVRRAKRRRVTAGSRSDHEQLRRDVGGRLGSGRFRPRRGRRRFRRLLPAAPSPSPPSRSARGS